VTFVYGGYDKNILEQMHKYIQIHSLDVELINGLCRDDMNNFYRKIDFLIITSKKDPLPTVVLESMNSATPVVGYAVDGVNEMIKNNENGYIIENLYDIDSLCSYIQETDQKKYEFLSKNALYTIKNKFDLKVKVKKIDKIIFEEQFFI